MKQPIQSFKINYALMKYFIFLLFIYFLINCKKEQTKFTEKTYFSADKLGALKINNLTDFLGTEELHSYASPFKGTYGYIDGVGYSTCDTCEKRGRVILVSVFESQEKALESMRNRIMTVACSIERGDTKELEGVWWSGIGHCLPSIVFKSQFNTIIEVYSVDPDIEKVKPELFKAIKEVSERINNLSE
jgi:hypothetical protein